MADPFLTMDGRHLPGLIAPAWCRAPAPSEPRDAALGLELLDAAGTQRVGYGTFDANNSRTWVWWTAMAPNIPPALCPPHKLDGYHLLWEAEWARVPVPPGDPALLKHVGGDLYAVLAVWDLSPLEQAVLAGTRA